MQVGEENFSTKPEPVLQHEGSDDCRASLRTGLMGSSIIGVMRCKVPHASIVLMCGTIRWISGARRGLLTNSKTSTKLSGALPVMSIFAVTVTWKSTVTCSLR